MAILEMKQISKQFSGVYANEKVDLSVDNGEILALLGENGAGKTTLMNILFGIYGADEGEIIWKGERVAFKSPKMAIAQGIGMVHQHFSLVQKLSVLDNMILGLTSEGFFLDRQKTKKRILELAEKYGLEVDPLAQISSLSVGQQQRVEILKALYQNAKLLILDEPTGVLTPKETEHFFDVLRKLKQEGHAIIIITHRMSEIMSISDRVSILRDGKLVGSLKTSETNPEELSHYMIGRQLENHFEKRAQQESEIALELKGVEIKKRNKTPMLQDLNFFVKKGEILGVAGVDGNGQKELTEVIAGVRKATAGTICFGKEDITRLGVRQRFTRGISCISDDRHADGLVLEMSVEENLILRRYREPAYSFKTLLNRKKIKASALAAIDTYKIKTSGTSRGTTPVKLLSGGNQQKVIIAREVSQEPGLVIANQPTRGLDIGATEFVRQVLVDQRNIGGSVILVSADLEEILALSDRIAVMFGGRMVGMLNREEATLEKLGLLMGGITSLPHGEEASHEH